MTKVEIAHPLTQTIDLLKFLQEEEIIHVVAGNHKKSQTVADEPITLDEPISSRLAQIQFCLNFLANIRNELNLKVAKPPIWQRFAGKPQATVNQLEKQLAELHFDQILPEITALNSNVAEIAAKQQSLREEIATLEPWSSLERTGDDEGGTAYAKAILISFGAQEEDFVHAKIQAIPTAVWQEVSRQSGEDKRTGIVFGEVVVHRSDSNRLQEIIRDTNAGQVSLPLDAGQTPAARIQILQNQLEDLKEKQQKVYQQAKELLPLEPRFKFSYDALLHRQERAQAQERMTQLAHIGILAGWIPQAKLPKFVARLEKKFSIYVAEVAPNPNESHPVALRNNRIVRPFEAVTDLYGKPAYSELDPTPFFSLFFLIAFGLALSDAGYGVIMMLATGLALKLIPLKRNLRKMVALLFYAGVSTLLFGALMGSWFSIDLAAYAANPIARALLAVKVLDPISQPITLLLVAFAIGMVQLLFARLVKAYDYIRQGDTRSALLDEISWVIFTIILLAWLGSRQEILPGAIEQPLLWLTVALAAGLVITQGRKQKNVFLKLGSGVLSLYGVVNFMSDTLSYARLLALGLATGIIGLVVNLLADLVAGSLPIVGVILAGVVLVIGHVFNIGINALGAFIHAGRLQFVEFFPKFIQGGGLAYQPLGRVSKYVDSPQDYVST